MKAYCREVWPQVVAKVLARLCLTKRINHNTWHEMTLSRNRAVRQP